MKCAVVAIFQLENNYLREWVEYYQKIGFDNVILIDNNYIGTEDPRDVIGDYIDNGFAILENFYFDEYEYAQCIGYEKMYDLYKDKYDWLAFFDIDEYLEFEECKTIKEYLSNPKFEAYDVINVIWKSFGDDNLVTVENNNYSVLNRFKKEIITNTGYDYQSKSIISTKNIDKHVGGGHGHPLITKNNDEVKRCIADGTPLTYISELYGEHIEPKSFKGAWLNHYRTKTIQEFLENRLVKKYDSYAPMKFIEAFFLYNEITKEKLEWLKNNYLDVYNELDNKYDLTTYYECDGMDKENVYKEYNVEK